jgi:hypothetical protein
MTIVLAVHDLAVKSSAGHGLGWTLAGLYVSWSVIGLVMGCSGQGLSRQWAGLTIIWFGLVMW